MITYKQVKLCQRLGLDTSFIPFSHIQFDNQREYNFAVSSVLYGAGIGGAIGGLTGTAIAALKKNKSYDMYKAEAEAKGEKPMSRVAYLAKSKEVQKGALAGLAIGAGAGGLLSYREHKRDQYGENLKEDAKIERQKAQKLKEESNKRKLEREEAQRQRDAEYKKWDTDEELNRQIEEKGNKLDETLKSANNELAKAKEYGEKLDEMGKANQKYLNTIQKWNQDAVDWQWKMYKNGDKNAEQWLRENGFL